jgi:3-deoxy-D-manno-octulosonic acid kinase
LTGDLFLSDSRCRNEADIMHALAEKGFPVVEVLCAISETLGLVKRLYLVTALLEGSEDLLDSLHKSGTRKRLRLVKRFAELLWELEKAGIYHPDLHLNNVLVTPEGDLFFLDFDRAYHKAITPADVESMLWRLSRFADKMEKQGRFRAAPKERALFLRTYEHLSGRSIEGGMAQKMRRKGYLHRFGWFVESLLYGR